MHVDRCGSGGQLHLLYLNRWLSVMMGKGVPTMGILAANLMVVGLPQTSWPIVRRRVVMRLTLIEQGTFAVAGV
jgi:hypothetical protein